MYKKIVFVFLFSTNSFLHPVFLTHQESKTMRTIQGSFLWSGLLISIVAFPAYVYRLPFRFTDADNQATEAVINAGCFTKSVLVPIAYRYGIIPVLIGIVPCLAGETLGDLVATLYVMRKHHVRYREAWETVHKNYRTTSLT